MTALSCSCTEKGMGAPGVSASLSTQEQDTYRGGGGQTGGQEAGV